MIKITSKGIMAGMLISTLFITSCNSRYKGDCAITVTADSAEHYDLNDVSDRCVLLQNSQMLPLANMIFTDSLLVVKSLDKICSFSLSNGNMKTDYSRKGHKKDEYISPFSLWIDEDSLFLLDLDSKKILEFDLTTETGAPSNIIDLTLSGVMFTSLARLNKNCYVGRRMFGVGEISELAVFDNGFNFIADIGNRNLKSGISGYNPFAPATKGGLLYAPFFMNVIEHINEDRTVEIKYIIDFGSNNIPQQIMRESEYEIMPYVSEHSAEVASFIDNIHETDKYLFFTFLLDHTLHFVAFNKATGKSRVIVFDVDGKVRKIVKQKDNILVLSEYEDNPSKVFIISDKTLSLR